MVLDTIHTVPDGWSTYPYVVSGYRVNLGWAEALESVFSMRHNEFWMIWTDVVPIWVFAWMYVSLPPDSSWQVCLCMCPFCLVMHTTTSAPVDRLKLAGLCCPFCLIMHTTTSAPVDSFELAGPHDVCWGYLLSNVQPGLPHVQLRLPRTEHEAHLPGSGGHRQQRPGCSVDMQSRE